MSPSYAVLVLPAGDSITVGNGDGSDMGGFRGPTYTLGQASTPFWWVGPFQGGNFTDNYHAGVDAVTAQTVSGQIAGYMNAAFPSITLIQVGTNDIAIDGVNAATCASRITDCATNAYAARKNPRGKIYICNVLRRLDAFNTTVQAANALLPASLASLAPYVVLIDQSNSLLDSDYADDVHPNATGYGKLAVLYWAAIQSTVQAVRVLG